MMTPARKKAFEILIIILGASYLMYRFFSLRAEMHPAGGVAGEMSAEMTRLKENINKAVIANKGDKVSAVPARAIFQKPGELIGDGSNKGIELSGMQNNALSLDGIIWGQGKNIAIISGTVVVEGDQIDEMRIVKIEPDRVTILKNGSEIVIKRGAPNDKKE